MASRSYASFLASSSFPADDVPALAVVVGDPDLFDLQRREVLLVLSLRRHLVVAPGPREDFLGHFLLLAHPGAQDVLQLPLFQRVEGLLADHAAIRHDADADDPEPLLQPVHYRDQRRHVRRVPRPHLAADRMPFAVQNHPHHHLLQVRPVVLAVAVLAQRLSSSPSK